MRRGPRCSMPGRGARCATPCLIRPYKDEVDDGSHRNYPMIEVREFGPQPVTLRRVSSNKEERQSEFGRINWQQAIAQRRPSIEAGKRYLAERGWSVGKHAA